MVNKCKETLIFVYAWFVTGKSGDNLTVQMKPAAIDGKQVQGNTNLCIRIVCYREEWR